jgi:hypothetical protein
MDQKIEMGEVVMNGTRTFVLLTPHFVRGNMSPTRANRVIKIIGEHCQIIGVQQRIFGLEKKVAELCERLALN